jgi:hypothetical protein
MDKIEKLLAKAQRAGTQEEADAFYDKAQELMVKWSVDEAMLQKSGKSHDELVTVHINMKKNGLFRVYVDLWVAVSKSNDVKVLMYAPGSWSSPGVDLIGWKTDVTKVQALFGSLIIHSQKERNNSIPEELKQVSNWSNSADVTRWRKSFMVGYASRISARLRETKKVVVEQETTKRSSVALALVDRSQAVDAYYNEIPGIKKSRSRSMRLDSEGYGAGQTAADKADIGQTRFKGAPGQLK